MEKEHPIKELQRLIKKMQEAADKWDKDKEYNVMQDDLK